MSILILAVVLWLGSCGTAWAEASGQELLALRQDVQHLSVLVTQLSATVQEQATRISQLEQADTRFASATIPVAAPPPVPAPQPRGTATGLSALNPEIGVVADMLGQLSSSSKDAEGNRKLSVREIELVFGHPIDPYSRFDSTITFSDVESPDIEEAYMTHWGLPGEIKAKLGRLRPKIGKASALHGDSLDTVDEPLVVSEYLGREGLFRTGLELSGFIPAPWTAVTHEITVGTIEGGVGNGGTLFGDTRRHPSLYSHLKNFWDLSDMTNVELGATYLTGSKSAEDHFGVNAVGLDATLTHYVTPANKLKWQTELYLQDRQDSFTVAGNGTRTAFDRNPWGLYALLDYRLSPRFGIGGRFDYVEPVDLDPATKARNADAAWAGYLTFYQSEFARWRFQFRHTDFAAGGDDNALLAQGTIAIGVHKHQLQ